MTFAALRRLAPLAACAAALACAAPPALADVHWVVTGTFDDQGALSGYFNIDADGYLTTFDLTTTAGGTLPGAEYTPENSYIWTGVDAGDYYVDFEPGDKNDLHLQFTYSLSDPIADNPIIGGGQGPSYECANSWSCYVAEGGPVRYLDTGFASAVVVDDVIDRSAAVPEPAAWALMIVGFGMAGGLLRARRRFALA